MVVILDDMLFRGDADPVEEEIELALLCFGDPDPGDCRLNQSDPDLIAKSWSMASMACFVSFGKSPRSTSVIWTLGS